MYGHEVVPGVGGRISLIYVAHPGSPVCPFLLPASLAFFCWACWVLFVGLACPPGGAACAFFPLLCLMFFHFVSLFGAPTSRYLCHTWLPPTSSEGPTSAVTGRKKYRPWGRWTGTETRWTRPCPSLVNRTCPSYTSHSVTLPTVLP